MVCLRVFSCLWLLLVVCACAFCLFCGFTLLILSCYGFTLMVVLGFGSLLCFKFVVTIYDLVMCNCWFVFCWYVRIGLLT